MKVKRVFTGDDGESHFEDVSAEEMATIVNRVGTGDISRRWPTPANRLNWIRAFGFDPREVVRAIHRLRLQK